MNISLTPNQLRQVRETIETLSNIAAGSSGTQTVSARRLPVTDTTNSRHGTVAQTSAQTSAQTHALVTNRLLTDAQPEEPTTSVTAVPVASSQPRLQETNYEDVSASSSSSSSSYVREG